MTWEPWNQAGGYVRCRHRDWDGNRCFHPAGHRGCCNWMEPDGAGKRWTSSWNPADIFKARGIAPRNANDVITMFRTGFPHTCFVVRHYRDGMIVRIQEVGFVDPKETT